MSEKNFTVPGAPGLLYGGDYNPDQWLDRPDILEEDIRLMKEARVNCVSLGIFAWAKLEPEEGKYELSWMGGIIDRLYENGIYTILATPTGALPAWMAVKYPEVLQTDEYGRQRIYGNRHNFCPSSPVMRSRARAVNMKLSEAFGRHPGVILWHISNEYGGNGSDAACHCELCQKAFREWLRERYGSLEELNRAWWTSFWSHTYTDWEQIHSPSPLGETTLHGLRLSWRRFVSDRLLDFCKEEIRAVRTGSDLPVTTNMMLWFMPINDMQWAKELDIISWDSYPDWHGEEDELNVASGTALQHSRYRTLKKKPFLLMESTPSKVNWREVNRLKRPGMNMLAGMQAIACGADSVQYFQWRAGRGSMEKFHGAVVGHLNGGNTRVFREVTGLGERLESLSGLVRGTVNRPRVAIVYDMENRWAAEDAWTHERPLDYVGLLCRYYRPLWERGIDVDVIDMESELSGYDLVLAPYNYMYRGDYSERVKRFVEDGGTYATTCFSGLVDANDLAFMDEHPLRALLGVRTEEEDLPGPAWKNSVTFDGRSYEVTGICGIVHAETAEVLAVYDSDYYAGFPALTRNLSGRGKAFYIAAECTPDFLAAVTDLLLREAGVTCPLDVMLARGVTVSAREAEDGTKLFFIQNFNRGPAAVTLNRPCRNPETGELLSGEVILPGFGCLVVE